MLPWSVTARLSMPSFLHVRDQLGDAVGTVEQGVLAVGVEMNEGHVGYRLSAIGYRLSAIGYRLSASAWCRVPQLIAVS